MPFHDHHDCFGVPHVPLTTPSAPTDVTCLFSDFVDDLICADSDFSVTFFDAPTATPTTFTDPVRLDKQWLKALRNGDETLIAIDAIATITDL